MPIVPDYNGGLPSVPASGGVSGGSAQVVNPNINYEATLAAASRTAAEGAMQIGELMKIQAARETKAASDDAERRAMELINKETLDPETGYFAQQGKNAMDQYQSTYDRIEKGLKEIGEGVPRFVYDTVKARLDDRLMSTQAAMGRHRMQQSQSYFIESSQSRIDALAEDIAQHYSDRDFIQKTSGSIAQELQYLANLRGWDDATLEEKSKAVYDKIWTMRYNTMAQDNPVEALREFQRDPDLRPSVRLQLGNTLYHAAKPLLIQSVVQGGGVVAMQAGASGGSGAQVPSVAPTGKGRLPSSPVKIDGAPTAYVAKTLGYRKNNPGNLRTTSIKWDGKCEPDDSGYETFKTPQHGIRAAAMNIRTAVKKHGADTIEKLLYRWADPKDGNDTEAYIRNVTSATGWDRNHVIQADNKDEVKTLLLAVMQTEMGGTPYSEAVINEGINAAFDSQVRLKSSGGGTPAAGSGVTVQDKWRIDLNAPTGDPVVDALPPAQKLDVLQSVVGARTAQANGQKADLRKEVENNLAEIADGKDPQRLTRERFLSVYGQGEGDEKFEAYEISANTNAAIRNFQTADVATIKSQLESAKPQAGDPNYAVKQKAYSVMEKAAQHVITERAKDPVGSAIAAGVPGFKPLDFGNLSSMGEQLKARREGLATMKEGWTPNMGLLSSVEVEQLGSALDAAPAKAKSAILASMGEAVGQENVGTILRQMKSRPQYALAMSCITEVPQGETASVGSMYLQGLEAIDQKRIQVDTRRETGVTASINNALGGDAETEPVFDDPTVMANTSKLVYGVWGYKALNGNSSVDDAMKTAVGEVYAHNGKKIILPRGVDASGGFFSRAANAVLATNPMNVLTGTKVKGPTTFESLLKGEAQKIASGSDKFYAGGVAITASELGGMLPALKLQTYSQTPQGGVVYRVIYNGSYVSRRTGKGSEDLLITIGGTK